MKYFASIIDYFQFQQSLFLSSQVSAIKEAFNKTDIAFLEKGKYEVSFSNHFCLKKETKS